MLGSRADANKLETVHVREEWRVGKRGGSTEKDDTLDGRMGRNK